MDDRKENFTSEQTNGGVPMKRYIANAKERKVSDSYQVPT